MTISFELPSEIEERIRNESIDVNDKAKEAFLVELYREQKITQYQLGQTLGLDDYETDGLLKRYGVGYELSLDEFEEQRAYLRERRSQ
ncbi:UPF0175 family protein [Paludisphaera borealis]|uniref:Uncharacterized protein n=1 Tax=Paludisphaera borealis TaxID=1387353 RepID=A0A1U7CS98_9BACT|nr:UPF0175 family protein [Paludisphaera borealis]APW61769.1 hypothetical protein BSF38_03297 [Paludisphaera borealis]MDR3623476.1 UPF0175 family protein [Paludisphaera borealis]